MIYIKVDFLVSKNFPSFFLSFDKSYFLSKEICLIFFKREKGCLVSF